MEIKKPKTVRQLCGENWLDAEIYKLTKRTQDNGVVTFYMSNEGFYRILVDSELICYNYEFIFRPLHEHFNLNKKEINSVIETSICKLGYNNKQAITPFSEDIRNIMEQSRVHI